MTIHKILELDNLCTGCFACQNICPKDAISLPEDKYGFYNPAINLSACVDCGLCDIICPRVSVPHRHSAKKAYFGWALNEEIRRTSSSGGLFTLFSNTILENGGVVYGAAFNYDGYIRLECHSSDEVPVSELRKSKYVQSYVGFAFRDIKNNLDKGRLVLFCGTPCEVEGLNSYLRKDYDNLTTVDFVCHGVPSMSLLNIHLSYLKLKGIKNINFRPKIDAWVDYLEIVHKSGIYRVPYNLDEYYDSFQSYHSIRPSCMDCQHCNGDRAADISLADFWGIYKFKPELYDKKGISLILANTDKGIEMVEHINESEAEIYDLDMKYADYVYKRVRTDEKSGYDMGKRNSYIHDVYTIGYVKANKKHGIYKSDWLKIKYSIKKIIKKYLDNQC